MAALTEEGIRAGALGFSTSRTLNHRTLDGRHIPTLRAEAAELNAIARAMRAAGAGWLQIVSDFEDQDRSSGCSAIWQNESGRPVTLTLLQSDARPDGWRALLDRIEEANAAGLRITGQVRSRPTSVLLGFELSPNPFSRPAQLQEDRSPAVRRAPARICAIRRSGLRCWRKRFEGDRGAQRLQRWDRMFPLGDPPNYEPAARASIAAMATRAEPRAPANWPTIC